MAQRSKLTIDRDELQAFWRAKRAEHERAMLRQGLGWGLLFSVPLWVVIVWLVTR